ncbi:MAG: TerC family protein, partial [Acidobacteriota bacterium]|nr:TerC family protein [Acidobacteriota bacterium]
SNLLCRLMERWPALVLAGSAILGKVGGEMVLTDPAMERAWNPGDRARWAVEASLAGGLMLYGWWRSRRARAAA